MKRFLVGFLIGAGAVYWYAHYGPGVERAAVEWAEDAASGYRGDVHRRQADELLR